jgi:hypothetical protein
MPRQSTERQSFPINDPNVQKYFGGNGTATTEYMKKVKSELANKDVKSPEDEKVVKWVDDTLSQVGKAEDIKKRIGMDTEAPGTKTGVDGTKSNHFKNRTEGNDENANPTKISTSPTKVGTNSREIMSNNFGESIDKEINGMKYLIEYMTKNK